MTMRRRGGAVELLDATRHLRDQFAITRFLPLFEAERDGSDE